MLDAFPLAFAVLPNGVLFPGDTGLSRCDLTIVTCGVFLGEIVVEEPADLLIIGPALLGLLYGCLSFRLNLRFQGVDDVRLESGHFP